MGPGGTSGAHMHPQAERCGQSSCEFLSRLREFACTGFICLLSAQASWLCQVRVTAQRQQENLHLCVCVCVCVCVCLCVCVCVCKGKIIIKKVGSGLVHHQFE